MSMVSLLKSVFNSCRNSINRWKAKRSLAIFKKHGYEALILFNDCLNKHNIRYSLAFGTLLGAIREHDFIPYDDDIDVAMWINDYRPELIDYLKQDGFSLKHTFSVDNDNYGKEISFDYKGVQVDIFFFYKSEDNSVYCCDFINRPGCANRKESIKKYGGLLPRKLYLPLGDNVTTTNFKGIDVSIPTNFEEILSFRYGEDYMTPKPGWKPTTDYIKEVPEWNGIYEEFKR